MFINFNGFNFQEAMSETVIIEVQIGNQVVQRFQSPLAFAKEQFRELCQEVSLSKTPMQVKCIRDEYTDEGKKNENCLTFQNKLFMNNFHKEGEAK
jgi:hypothetical protein